MPLRKLVPFIATALALAACSSESITGPAGTPKTSGPAPRYESADGLGSLGGGGRS